MANHGCINGMLVSANYSSPMPMMGVYIAAASLVCLLLMLYDMFVGCRARKSWLPCKFFTLSSLTLTLLSVAAKTPLDLTTPMPSPRDQLSKLSGTTFICMSLGILFPSLRVNAYSGSFTNLVSLTIFSMTIFVIICIQLSTGVIVLFITEHIITLGCMFLLVILMWYSYWDTFQTKACWTDYNKDRFTNKRTGALLRLESLYLNSYCYNPQLAVCLDQICVVVGVICPLCPIILLQATFWSIILRKMEFCLGVSDYGRSMLAIVVIQILTVILGSFVTVFRWISLSKHIRFNSLDSFIDIGDPRAVIAKNPILGTVSRCEEHLKFLRNLYLRSVETVQSLIVLIPRLLIVYFWLRMDASYDPSMNDWTHKKAKEDMKRWMHACKSESANHLSQVLSRTCPSQQQWHGMEIRDQAHPNQEGIHVSSLSMSLLVKIAQVSLPDNLCRSLVQSCSEATDVIYFIDKMTSPRTTANKNRLLFAKAVWAGDLCSSLLAKINESPTYNQPYSGLDHATLITTKLKSILPSDPVSYQLGIIADFINRRSYTSVQDLSTFMEQMFVDMLHVMFAQLPNAILNKLRDSPPENYEDIVKHTLKLLCRVESLETLVHWTFPICDDSTSLKITGASVQEEVDVSINVDTQVHDDDIINSVRIRTQGIETTFTL